MRTVVLSASLIAFSVACGYAKLLLFPYLFFVELFTVALFLSGILMGWSWGLWVGGIARVVFSVANPYGPPHPWILLAQVAGGASTGALGGLARPWLLRGAEGRSGSRARTAILLVSGFAATFIYDLMTNLAQGVVFGSIPAALALGVLPAAQHIASNLAIFATVGTVALPWLRRHPVVAQYAV